METIVACRERISPRHPVASFVVRVPVHRLYEVACAADPRLLHRTYAAHRTPANFYCSGADGLLRTSRGEATFLVPARRLAQLAGATKLYYALGSYGGPDRHAPRFCPEPGDLARVPFIAISPDFGAGARAARYGAVSAGSLRWGTELAVARAFTEPARSGGEQQFHQSERRHAGEGLLGRLTPGSGEDDLTFAIPDGLRFSRWEVEVVGSSPGAGYEMVAAPSRGATGRQTCRVRWHHGPGGRIEYRIRVHASADGASPEQSVAVDEPGWEGRARDLFRQGAPTRLELRGENARRVADAVLQEGRRRNIATAAMPEGMLATIMVAGVDDAIIIAVIAVVCVLGLAVIAALCFALGLFVVAMIIKTAMENDYEVIDADYGFGSTEHAPLLGPSGGGGDAGGGQDHKLGFKMRKRQPA